MPNLFLLRHMERTSIQEFSESVPDNVGERRGLPSGAAAGQRRLSLQLTSLQVETGPARRWRGQSTAGAVRARRAPLRQSAESLPLRSRDAAPTLAAAGRRAGGAAQHRGVTARVSRTRRAGQRAQRRPVTTGHRHRRMPQWPARFEAERR